MIDGILEAILPPIGRAIGYLVIEILGHVICYLTGFAIIKVITFGNYPKQFISPKSDADQEPYVLVTGCAFWFIVLILTVAYFIA